MDPQVSIVHELWIALAFTGAFGLMFLISELVYSKFRVDAEITRKFIHLSCGSIAMLVPLVRPHLYTIIILGVFFSCLTFYMLRKGLLPSVHGVKRQSIGSVLFPLGIVLCTIFGLMDNYRLYFFIPMSMLIFSDSVAAFAGINFPIRKFRIMGFSKSLGGSLGFFICALALCIFINSYYEVYTDWKPRFFYSFILALGTTLVEMLSVDGWDDIMVPVSAFFILWSIGM